jgi:iron complex outermembrane receptor protein
MLKKTGLGVLLTAAAVLAPATAMAQEDEIVVTGTRIPRPNLEQPTPVSTISQELIQNSGTSNLGDVIAQLPALSFSGTVRANGNSFGDIGGLNFPDLRDLGTSRTLTLVDGKRHVAGDAGDSAVDLNSIPPALVERVEVITGGASAIYGSDAVTGVINIITRHDFDGVEGQFQYATPTEGDYGQNWSANATFGQNFNNDRGNVTVSVMWDQNEAVEARDISSLANYGTIINSNPGDGIPDRLLVPYVLSEYIDENGVLQDYYSGTPIAGFDLAGNPVTQPTRLGDNSFAFGQFAGPCDTCFQLEDWLLLVPETERGGINVSFDYELTPNLNFYATGKFIESHIYDYVQPAFSFFEDDFAGFPPGGGAEIQFDNAFLTPAILDRVAAFGTDRIEVARFLGDVGGRSNDITRSTARAVVGFNGEIASAIADFDWDVSYNYGVTNNRIESYGDRITGNYFAAIDSVVAPDGQIRCRIDVPTAWYPGYTPPSGLTDDQCVPYNPFGQQNTQAAYDYITYTAVRHHTITQQVFDATVNFDTGNFLNLPGGAIGIAAGVEHRRETSENRNDPFVQLGLADTAPQPDAFGEFDVSEGFVEAYLPILADQPFFQELSVDLAYRYASYDPFGNTSAYKVGGVWAPVHDLAFRGTYSEAVRAPNITEAFLPPTSAFFSVSDPCDADNVSADPDRAANCAALGIPADFQAVDNAGIPGEASGNPNLDSEESVSWTAGIVLQPRWVPNLSVTLDYYNIEITDAITFVDEQDIVNNCVDATGGPDFSFCDLFTRNAQGNINFISSSYVNASKLLTSGWDLEIRYQTSVVPVTEHLGPLSSLNGDLSVSMNVNYLERLRVFNFQDRPDEEDIFEDTIGDPRTKLLSRIAYEQGNLTLGWESRFMSQVIRYNPNRDRIGAEAISPSSIEPQWYHDLTAQYQIGGEDGHYEIYGGVNNIFDEEAPTGIVQGDGTDASYDLIGRTVFVGARARF